MLKPMLIAVALAAAAGTTSAQDVQEAEYVREFKAASEFQFACYGQQDDTACASMLAAYDRAMAAPDATEAARHFVFKQRLHVVAVRGGNLREAGDAAAALEIVGPGYAAMMEHFDGGKHFHTLIDNLRLQQETVLALAALGRIDEAENVLRTAREAATGVHGSREQAMATDHGRDLLHAAYIGSETLETEVADWFRDRSRADDAGDTAAAHRERALDAYRRAEEWLQRKVEAGIRGGMDVRADLRLSQLKVEQGALLLDADAGAEAEAAFLAGSASCMYLDAAEVERFDLTPPHPVEVPLFQSACDRARLGWGLASGEAARYAKEAADRMIEEQLAILREAAED